MNRKSLVVAGVGSAFVLALLVVSTTLGPAFFHISSSNGGGNSSKTGPAPTSNVMSVSTLVNYGNGTSVWYNETDVPIGMNFTGLTLKIASGNVLYRNEPLLGHFIIGINGVLSNGVGSDCSYCWGIWIYCLKDTAWMYSILGADLIKPNNRDVFAWYIQNISQNLPPEPGAKTIATCSS